MLEHLVPVTLLDILYSIVQYFRFFEGNLIRDFIYLMKTYLYST